MNTIKLKEEFIQQLVDIPESGMGYQVVTIKLANGLVLKKRIVLNSEFLKLEDNEIIDPNDIIEVIIDEKNNG